MLFFDLMYSFICYDSCSIWYHIDICQGNGLAKHGDRPHFLSLLSLNSLITNIYKNISALWIKQEYDYRSLQKLKIKLDRHKMKIFSKYSFKLITKLLPWLNAIWHIEVNPICRSIKCSINKDILNIVPESWLGVVGTAQMSRN